MRIRFRCHHAQPVNEKAGAQRCVTCGETRIARVLGARLPRFRGHGSGPLVESAALDAIPVPLAKTHLRLKPRVVE